MLVGRLITKCCCGFLVIKALNHFVASGAVDIPNGFAIHFKNGVATIFLALAVGFIARAIVFVFLLFHTSHHFSAACTITSHTVVPFTFKTV